MIRYKCLLVWNIIITILLVCVLGTYYAFNYCDNDKCYVGRQLIFDYIIGKN